LTEDKDKTLPKDIDSDYSLPGRFEESNSEYFDAESVGPKPNNRIILVIGVVFVIFTAGFFSYYFINQDDIDSRLIQNSLKIDPEKQSVNQFGVGEYGSEHAHAAIAVFVDGVKLDFSLPQFQLSSKYIHFENHNSYLIHSHATNVPLEMLFASFGMKVTSDCIILNYDEFSKIQSGSFCTGKEKSLMIYVNGEKHYSDISQYVLEHNDRILISFGDVQSISKQLEYLESLKIFDIPKDTPQFSENNIRL
jgi:hypothetical protein